MTRSYDALYVQIAVEQTRSKRPEENLTPTRLLESALKAEIVERTVVEGNNAAALWEEVKKVSSSATPEDNSLLSKILLKKYFFFSFFTLLLELGSKQNII